MSMYIVVKIKWGARREEGWSMGQGTDSHCAITFWWENTQQSEMLHFNLAFFFLGVMKIYLSIEKIRSFQHLKYGMWNYICILIMSPTNISLESGCHWGVTHCEAIVHILGNQREQKWADSEVDIWIVECFLASHTKLRHHNFYRSCIEQNKCLLFALSF